MKHLVLACAYCDQATPPLTRADLEAELQQRDKRRILAIGTCKPTFPTMYDHSHENTNKNIQKDLLFRMMRRQFNKMDWINARWWWPLHTHTHTYHTYCTPPHLILICTHYGQKSLSFKRSSHFQFILGLVIQLWTPLARYKKRSENKFQWKSWNLKRIDSHLMSLPKQKTHFANQSTPANLPELHIDQYGRHVLCIYFIDFYCLY